MNALTPFIFDDRQLRVVDCGGEPWFVANDVCFILGLANARDAVEKLDADEKAAVGLTDTSSNGVSQSRTVNVVSESGLYALVLRCRDAMTPGTTPHRFRKWVTSEVLPSIRRTGGYGRPQPDPMLALNDPATMRGLLLTYSEKVLELEAANAELMPKADALDRIAKADGALCITDAAKALQVRPKDLFSELQRRRWIYRRPGSGRWLGYQEKVQRGLLYHKVTTVHRPDGDDEVHKRVLVTPKGLSVLAQDFSTH